VTIAAYNVLCAHLYPIRSVNLFLYRYRYRTVGKRWHHSWTLYTRRSMSSLYPTRSDIGPYGIQFADLPLWCRSMWPPSIYRVRILTDTVGYFCFALCDIDIPVGILLLPCETINHSCSVYVKYILYVWGKFANFNELYNVNEFYVLQNEILIFRKNVTIPCYLIRLQKFAIVWELLRAEE